MCGIVGFFSTEENKHLVIKKMTDRISHRGPDQEGYYIDNNIAFGYRRLSIIDLKSGNQPMVTEDKNLIVIFNGEIYNYLELQLELKEKGYKFKTNSDTEVLLHGYKEWKYDLPKKLRGMFAFAIWDKKNELLFCARDNFGIKPLYYYKTDEVFMFSSEIKSFLEHPKFKKILNKNLLPTYLLFNFTPTSETFFKEVYCLEAGHSLVLKNNNISIYKYYDINFEEKNKDFNKVVDDIRNVMENSIKYHMVSDVEIGAFLSSGIDSSYVVSLAKPANTYTVGYNSSKYSEIDYAENLTQKLEINNINKKITKEEYMNTVTKMLYYMDEPFSDPSAISLYFLSKLASNDVKVVLSGEGADEFFGGYNTYKDEIDFSFYNKIPFCIRHLLAIFFEKFPEFRGRNFIVRRGSKLEDIYTGVNKIFSEKEIKKALDFSFFGTCKNITSYKITKPIFDKYIHKNNVIKMQATDINLWLVRNILLKADKMTMANSVEARTPFLDKKVFEIASSLPMQYKLSKTNTKIALREASKKIIPNKAYEKKKLGFPVPLREWMREDDVYNEIKKTICSDYAKQFFNQNYVIHLLDQHKTQKRDNYKKVWSIYCFIKWYEIFFIENT